MFNKASDTLSDYYYFQADIKGNSSVPDMSGTARFYPWLDGTMVEKNSPVCRQETSRSQFIFTRAQYANPRHSQVPECI